MMIKKRIILLSILVFSFLSSCSKEKTTESGPVFCTGRSTYTSIQIGSQVWLGENLNVCTYRNGEPIPQVIDPAKWDRLTTGAWCYYNDDPKNGTAYGKLYNWYALSDPRGLAPIGWHVPSDSEWTTLTKYLGGDIVAGGKLKETGTTYWISPNTGATNASYFSARPGGYCADKKKFGNIGDTGSWWSATNYYGVESAWYRYLNYDNAFINRSFSFKTAGYSVRCIRDY